MSEEIDETFFFLLKNLNLSTINKSKERHMLPKQYNSDLHKKVQILLGSISNLTNLQPFNEQKISMKDNF